MENRLFYKNFFSIYIALVLQNVVTLSVNLADNIMLGDIYMRAKELRVTADVPRPDASPPYPPAGVERKRIAAYAGEVWRAEGNR